MSETTTARAPSSAKRSASARPIPRPAPVTTTCLPSSSMARSLLFGPVRSREVRLAQRPVGEPKPEDFELAEVELGEPGDGRLLVRNAFMSVDPYMRGRMNDAKSYVPPYELGKVMYGGAVGEVVAGGEPGSLVVHQLGWREAALVDADRVQPGAVPDGVSPSALLGALGMPGLTAWVGVTEIAPIAEGETVFVSAAAGAVGSVAGQIAKARGCRVIGSAGAPEKVAYLRDVLGFDAAFSHRDDVRAALAEAAPDGVDVYFDNVGGPQLEAAIGALNRGGRIALCGAVSQYNATEPAPGPRNLGAAGRQARAHARLHRLRPRRVASRRSARRSAGCWPTAGSCSPSRSSRAGSRPRRGRSSRCSGASTSARSSCGCSPGRRSPGPSRAARRAPSARCAPRTPPRSTRARPRAARSGRAGTRAHAQSVAVSTVQPAASGTRADRLAEDRVEVAHPVAPRLAPGLAGDRGRLERAGDRQDLGHVGEPLAQQPLERLRGRELARGGHAVGEAAAAVAVAGHRGEQPGAAAEVDVDHLPRQAGGVGDGGHRHGVRALLADELEGGVEDALAGVGHARSLTRVKHGASLHV